jgi:hypothetical protein
MSDCKQGFGLDTGFIDHFNTQLVIPLNYSAIANFHTLNKSLVHTLSLFKFAVSSLVVAWSWLLTMAIPLLPGSSPVSGGSLPTAFSSQTDFQLTSSQAGGYFTPTS